MVQHYGDKNCFDPFFFPLSPRLEFYCRYKFYNLAVKAVKAKSHFIVIALGGLLREKIFGVVLRFPIEVEAIKIKQLK